MRSVNISEFRANLLKYMKLANSGEEVSVTCSIGVSNVGRVVEQIQESGAGNGDTVKAIFETAFNASDRYVKEAKRNGKNQIIFPGRQQAMTFL